MQAANVKFSQIASFHLRNNRTDDLLRPFYLPILKTLKCRVCGLVFIILAKIYIVLEFQVDW